jgi:hypothetical protein
MELTFLLPTHNEETMSINYNLIQPPYKLNFKLMDRKQANEFSNWFITQIPERITELTRYVKSTPGFENWDANLSPNSLDDLGTWFYSHVQTRPRSKQETEAIYSNSPGWFKQIEIPDYDISGLTISICIDIGMYICQILLMNMQGLRWEVVTKPKNNVNFQMPVLKGDGKLSFSPIQLLTTLAYGIAAGTKKAKDLRDLYETWVYFLQE